MESLILTIFSNGLEGDERYFEVMDTPEIFTTSMYKIVYVASLLQHRFAGFGIASCH